MNDIKKKCFEFYKKKLLEFYELIKLKIFNMLTSIFWYDSKSLIISMHPLSIAQKSGVLWNEF